METKIYVFSSLLKFCCNRQQENAAVNGDRERATYVKARLVKGVSGAGLCAAGTDPLLRK